MIDVPIYPRTGTFYQAVPLQVSGGAWDGGFGTMLLDWRADPPETDAAGWVPAVEVGETRGLLVTGQAPGLKRVWAHPTGLTDPPEDPVIDCGFVLIV